MLVAQLHQVVVTEQNFMEIVIRKHLLPVENGQPLNGIAAFDILVQGIDPGKHHHRGYGVFQIEQFPVIALFGDDIAGKAHSGLKVQDILGKIVKEHLLVLNYLAYMSAQVVGQLEVPRHRP